MKVNKNCVTIFIVFYIILIILLSVSIIGGKYINNLPGWDDSFGNPGTIGTINAIIEFDVDNDGIKEHIFGGNFDEIGGINADNIAYWNPDSESWKSMGEIEYDGGSYLGLPDDVGALAIYDYGHGPYLIAGGCFIFPEGDYGFRGDSDVIYEQHLDEDTPMLLALWNVTEQKWYPVGITDDSSDVESIIVYPENSDKLYVGGNIMKMKRCTEWVYVNNLALLDGIWGSVGLGVGGDVNDCVHDMVIYQDELYVGGHFDSVRNDWGEVANTIGIARWNGDEWFSVGHGIHKPDGMGDPGCVHTVAVFDDGYEEVFFAGGMFISMDQGDDEEILVNNIATWDPVNQWQALISGDNNEYIGLPNIVKTITSFDDGTGPGLFVGGNFITAGGKTVGRIAKWDGDDWYPLKGGVNGDGAVYVNILHALQTNLYVGGAFDSIGDEQIPSFNIALWLGQDPIIPGDNTHIDNSNNDYHTGNIQVP